VKRLPLGQLDRETVLEGYKYLSKIELVLSGKDNGDLAELSSKFFTYIPHNFSMKNMSNFIIDTHAKLKEKLDLIQNLVDINIGKNLLNEMMKYKDEESKENPID
jgi:poly [ADP-ribose] polymerase